MLGTVTGESANMSVILFLLLTCFTSGVLSDIDSPGCGINDVGFDYNTLPKVARKRIVGGQIATPHSFPWMVALEYRGVFSCAGSLLKGSSNRWYILTAAHCLHGTMVSDWKIRLGAHDLSETEPSTESIDVKAMMSHPLFKPLSLQHDTGLMELERAPKINRPEINFGCVTGNVSVAGETCYVIGWGTTSEESAPSDMLQIVEKPVMSKSACRNIYGSNDFHDDSMICAGFPEGGKDACKADSGGPLMCYRDGRMEIIGTVSWGFGCAKPNSPAVYASATGAIQWIVSTINA